MNATVNNVYDWFASVICDIPIIGQRTFTGLTETIAYLSPANP
jgi:hypothetical protein